MRNLLLLLPLSLLACKPKLLDDATDANPQGDDDDDSTGDDDDDTVGDDDDDDDDCACDEGLECIDDVCVDCSAQATWPGTVDTSTIHLTVHEAAPDAQLLLARPVDLPGGVALELGQGLELYTEAGDPVVDGDTLTEGRHLLVATEVGSAELGLLPPTACESSSVVVPIEAHNERPIVGRELSQAPFVERVALFQSADVVSLAVDSAEHADRMGVEAELFVVDDRDEQGWIDDPSFGTPVHQATVTLGTDTEAWASLPTGAGILGRYDVVLDIDGDGALSPGDLMQGLHGPAMGVAGDLAAQGPHAVTEFEWSVSYWLTQKTYYPTDMSALDPVPIVVISHGNGHDYRWYDYLGRHLASWGYVVTSHRNDTMPGVLAAKVTLLDNTSAFLAEYETLDGGALAGEIDTSAIAWIGHSRGGEGVVLAYDDLVDGAATPFNYSAADIQLVSSIAPTIFQGPRSADPNDAPYHLIAGSSDGDVTGGPDCDLCQYFRIFKNGTAPAWVTYFQGSTHNDFHDDEPGAFDDGIFVTGLKIGSQPTQAGAKSYYLALLEHVFRGDELLDDYFERPPETFRPEQVDFILSTQSWRSTTRSVIEDYQSEPALETSSSGGVVVADVTNLLEGLADDGNNTLSSQNNDPMNGMTWADDDGNDSERCAVFEWTGDTLMEFELTGSLTDASTATHLSLRAAQATRHNLTTQLGGMLSFTVALVDANGTEVGFDTRAWGGIPKPARRSGGGSGNGTGWVNEFQTLRLPLEAYTAEGSGLDLSQLTHVRLRFGPSFGSDVGRIGLDDLEFLTEDSP